MHTKLFWRSSPGPKCRFYLIVFLPLLLMTNISGVFLHDLSTLGNVKLPTEIFLSFQTSFPTTSARPYAVLLSENIKWDQYMPHPITKKLWLDTWLRLLSFCFELYFCWKSLFCRFLYIREQLKIC